MKKLFLAAALLSAGITCAAQRVQPEFSDVYSPDIPAAVTLCGKTFNLDRADMYENFDRELSSLCYT
ncbi:MAG: hypothetical protein K2I04_00405, partial [Muribaculaceae bacterium]|nr:hypothetical protein [Muribaculaceae bacterium]